MSSRKSKKNNRKPIRVLNRDPLESLRRKVQEGPLAGIKVIVTPSGSEKMSEVLDDFIAPYRGMTENREGYRKLLSLGMLAWNAALLPQEKRAEMIDRVMREGLPPDDGLVEELRLIIEGMIERKLMHFSTNRRAIISFEVEETARDYQVRVAATLDDAPFARPDDR